jgi:hypothetical protein
MLKIFITKFSHAHANDTPSGDKFIALIFKSVLIHFSSYFV